MKKSKLTIKLLILSAVIVLVPVITTAYVYYQNMMEVETGTVQRMFRERHASYDRVFDFVEVTYDPEKGVEYTSQGIQLLLDNYDARLQVIRADGVLLYDSEDPSREQKEVDLDSKLKLASDPTDLFSTINRYIRPVRQIPEGEELDLDRVQEVAAYAVITDDIRAIERNLHADMSEYYTTPYYYGIGAFLLVLLLAWVLLYREILRPIHNLRTSTREIAGGNLDFDISCSANNELGELCEDFGGMKQSLKKSMQKRLEEKDRNRMYVKSIAEDLKEPVDKIEQLKSSLSAQQQKELEMPARQLNDLLEDLSRYTDYELAKFVLQREIVSVYRFFETWKERRISKHTDRETVTFLEPRENSMLFLDVTRMIKMLDNLLFRMDEYTGSKTPLYVESASDVLEYNMLQIKIYWAEAEVLPGDTLEDILQEAYMKEAQSEKHNLAAALVMVREILEDSGGDFEMLSGDGKTGFIIRIPRYTPDMI